MFVVACSAAPAVARTRRGDDATRDKARLPYMDRRLYTCKAANPVFRNSVCANHASFRFATRKDSITRKMNNIELTLAFEGTSREDAATALQSAEIIIPHMSYENTDRDAPNFKVTVHDVTVISFTGMMKDFCNRSKASVEMTGKNGEKVQISPEKDDFHFADVEKQIQGLL